MEAENYRPDPCEVITLVVNLTNSQMKEVKFVNVRGHSGQ